MKTKLIIILFTSLLGCEQCDHDPPLTELEKLPPATQEGKNTFGCLVNGKAWVTKTSIDANAYYQDQVLGIGAHIREKGRIQNIIITVADEVVDDNAYDLTNYSQSIVRFNWQRSAGTCWYDPENTMTGHLTITKLDQLKLIVSGLFEFTTYTPGCDTIRVTHGRFDLTYAN